MEIKQQKNARMEGTFRISGIQTRHYDSLVAKQHQNNFFYYSLLLHLANLHIIIDPIGDLLYKGPKTPHEHVYHITRLGSKH